MEALLNHHQKQAVQAHYWTSFSPEKRGEQLINDYNNQLSEDIEELKTAGIEEDIINSYKTRYESLFASWLSAKGRCISSMITGPAKFPTRRAEKANRSEDNHYTLWQEWRIRAKKSIVIKAQPVKTFVSELERYKSELAGMKRSQEIMKACNIVIKKSKGKDCTNELIAAGLNEDSAQKIQLPDFAGRKGFASFSLTNNNANMKRIEEMIKTLEQKKAMREVSPITEYSFDGGKLIVNYEVDRLQIIFTTRPTSTELSEWKEKGLNSYNWSPSVSAWQRKITSNALYSVKRMLPQLTKIN